ncbi:MAG: hypothetical protein AABY11_04080 [archaeon]
MHHEKFLSPTPLKLGLTVFLFLLSSVVWAEILVVSDATLFGFPATVMMESSFHCESAADPDCGNPEYLLDYALVDLIFWYLISAVITTLLAMFVVKSKKR